MSQGVRSRPTRTQGGPPALHCWAVSPRGPAPEDTRLYPLLGEHGREAAQARGVVGLLHHRGTERTSEPQRRPTYVDAARKQTQEKSCSEQKQGQVPPAPGRA